MRRLQPLVVVALTATLSAMPWLASVADAAVVARSAAGFVLSHEVSLAGSPDQAYGAIVDIAGWWHPDHTYAGDAGGLSLDARAGGCFCETLPNDGSVEHMRVVFAAPGKRLRLAGGLGPLQAMGASGVMEFALIEQPDGRTLLRFGYTVTGFAADGLDGMADPVDDVLRIQLARLADSVAAAR